MENGLIEVCRGNQGAALEFFDAAIHRARKRGLEDNEAHFFKFVTFYLGGEFGRAVRQCVICMRCVEETALLGEIDGLTLPREMIIPKLERLLVDSMIRRGTTLFGLTLHHWRRSMGEYYPAKKSTDFVTALRRAARAMARARRGVDVHYRMFDRELFPFTGYLCEKTAALRRSESVVARETYSAAAKAPLLRFRMA